MSKLFISADLEGVCGVTSPRQCSPTPDRPAYDAAVAQLGNELRVLIEALVHGGATAITVNDSHMSMTNLRLDHLPAHVRLLSGKPKICAMAAGLDETYDGLILLGYHAKAGTAAGVLCHTFHGKLYDVSVNGISYGEGGINALHASLSYGVPLILASGDRAFCEEISTLAPSVALVETKDGLSEYAALNHPVETVYAAYRDRAGEVIAQAGGWKKQVFSLQGPYALQVTFTRSLYADIAMTMPWLTRIDGRTVGYQADTFARAYQALQSCYSILAYADHLE